MNFELEQSIMEAWHITDDIGTLTEEVIEGEPTKDNISNILIGLSDLYEIKFAKLFREYETFLKEYYELRKRVEVAEGELYSQAIDKINNTPSGPLFAKQGAQGTSPSWRYAEDA